MNKSLKILFIPIGGVGHVNACVGIAEVLRDSGHNITFALNEQWMGRLTEYGFEEVLLSEVGMKVGDDPAKHMANLIKDGAIFKASSTIEKMIQLTETYQQLMEPTKEKDMKIEVMLKTVCPDVIVLDQPLSMPSVIKSGIPWVHVASGNPLYFIDDEKTPPGLSGLPAMGPQKEWKAFRSAFNEAKRKGLKKWSDYMVSRGVEPLNGFLYINSSKYMNIYGFPMELDYLDMRPLPPNWYRFDNLKRTDSQMRFEVPEQLRGKPGKLIYFSLGSMGSVDVVNMKRLIGILGKSKHRYIISKGPLHSEYSLTDNMWGQQSVPQIQVLPLIDLVITHGGNNTVTETFYFGKPMIVLPLFADQYDNAQRIQEKGFGLRLDAYLCTESELLDGIEKLLNDKELNEKLLQISERIQTENSIGKLPKLIEDLINK